jgi:uncharacterized protein YjbJ (UPF0337 family)
MANVQAMMGNWNEIVGKICSRWGQLTENDLQQFRGNLEELVGLIQQKTGESRDAIQNFLSQFSSQGVSAVSAMADQARRYVGQAAERFQGASRQMADSLRSGYGQAQQMVQQRPGQSLATAFGAGLVIGMVLGLVLAKR